MLAEKVWNGGDDEEKRGHRTDADKIQVSLVKQFLTKSTLL